MEDLLDLTWTYISPFLYKRCWIWFTPWINSPSCFFLCWCRRVLTICKRSLGVNPYRSHWWLRSIHTIPSSSPPHRVSSSPPKVLSTSVITTHLLECRRLSSYSWHCHLSITSHFCPPFPTCRDASCLLEPILPCHCPLLGVINRTDWTELFWFRNRTDTSLWPKPNQTWPKNLGQFSSVTKTEIKKTNHRPNISRMAESTDKVTKQINKRNE